MEGSGTAPPGGPSLSGPGTGPLPVTPGQQGDAAAAMKKAEDDLARQNSVTAQLDLHVIGAILGAHAVAAERSERLRRLQQEVESAVQSRTDLDTPSGAKDFQRYLIGKLREIGAVVESGDLDDRSKAALAGAWTALYENSRGTPSDAAGAAAGGTEHPAGAQPADATDALPPYGGDAGEDPLLDSLLGESVAEPAGTGWAAASPAAAPSPAAPSSLAPLSAPMLPMPGVAPAAAGAPPSLGGLGEVPRSDFAGLSRANGWPGDDDEDALDALLDADYPAGDTDESLVAGLSDGDGFDGVSLPEESPGLETLTVRLPGGGTAAVPNSVIAEVIRSVVGGTTVGEAFEEQGMIVPPPGTAVPHPVDPAQIVAGDIGMFTDRHALAVDSDRALLDGRIHAVASVGGPSFLGWLHPPSPAAASSATPPSTTPHQGAPAPTRPAIVDAR